MPHISTRFNFALELLESLVKDYREGPTSVVVCASREDFLDQVLLQVQQPPTLELPSSQQSEVSTLQHSFLVPTLGLLAASSSVKLVYCPTLPILRAYISSYVAPPGPQHRLVLLDLIALHHGTSEFNLQGLSRTLAAVVSAARLRRCHLDLVECKDISDPTNPYRGPRLWDVQVPLLSGSIKIGQEGSRWAARAVTIKQIAARWFSFGSAVAGDAPSKPNEQRGDSREVLI